MCGDKYVGIRTYGDTSERRSVFDNSQDRATKYFIVEDKASREFKEFVETTARKLEELE